MSNVSFSIIVFYALEHKVVAKWYTPFTVFKERFPSAFIWGGGSSASAICHRRVNMQKIKLFAKSIKMLTTILSYPVTSPSNQWEDKAPPWSENYWDAQIIFFLQNPDIIPIQMCLGSEEICPAACGEDNKSCALTPLNVSKPGSFYSEFKWAATNFLIYFQRSVQGKISLVRWSLFSVECQLFVSLLDTERAHAAPLNAQWIYFLVFANDAAIGLETTEPKTRFAQRIKKRSLFLFFVALL